MGGLLQRCAWQHASLRYGIGLKPLATMLATMSAVPYDSHCWHGLLSRCPAWPILCAFVPLGWRSCTAQCQPSITPSRRSWWRHVATGLLPSTRLNSCSRTPSCNLALGLSKGCPSVHARLSSAPGRCRWMLARLTPTPHQGTMLSAVPRKSCPSPPPRPTPTLTASCQTPPSQSRTLFRQTMLQSAPVAWTILALHPSLGVMRWVALGLCNTLPHLIGLQ